MKKIVVYFSYSGNTKMIAEKIGTALGCDTLEIKTVKPYSPDYNTVVNEEEGLAKSDKTPEIEKFNVNLAEYDTVIIGTPTWWYRPAPAIRAFLKENDLSGKTVIPFATNAGWVGNTLKEIEALCPNSNVENEKNIVFNSNRLKTSEKEVNNWVKSLK